MFLEGRTKELVGELRREMLGAADEERYEQAAHLRDAIATETLRDRKEKMVTPRLGDCDAFGLKLGTAGVTVQAFQMRGGRVIDRIDLSGDATSGAASEAEIIEGGRAAVLRGAARTAHIHVPPWRPTMWSRSRAGYRRREMQGARGRAAAR